MRTPPSTRASFIIYLYHNLAAETQEACPGERLGLGEDRIRAEGQSLEVEGRLAMERFAAQEAGSLEGESPVGPRSPPVKEEVALATLTEVLAMAAEAEQVAAAVVEEHFDSLRSASQYARSCMVLAYPRCC